MADLTLYEYRDLPEDELQKIFQEEVRNMFGAHAKDDDLEEASTTSQSISQPDHDPTIYTPKYWTDVLAFVSQPFNKI